MTFTQTSESVAIFCLAKNDWKLEQASDNFFQSPHEYETVKINTHLGFIVDKRKLEAMYARYRGKIVYYLLHLEQQALIFSNRKNFVLVYSFVLTNLKIHFFYKNYHYFTKDFCLQMGI